MKRKEETRNKEADGTLLYLSSLPSLPLPFPSIIQKTRPFLLFADQRRDQKECNFNGKSNEKNGREMKTGEGGAKSG